VGGGKWVGGEDRVGNKELHHANGNIGNKGVEEEKKTTREMERWRCACVLE
jgi:hypothetical protein